MCKSSWGKNGIWESNWRKDAWIPKPAWTMLTSDFKKKKCIKVLQCLQLEQEAELSSFYFQSASLYL